MARTYTTSAGDMLDAIAWRLLGHHRMAVEAMFEANPELSQHDPELPGGITIVVPDVAPPSAQRAVKLWE